MAISTRSHRKQILLFLLAVILPSLVLVVFTLHMINQERELDQKRAADEHRRKAGDIGQHLLVRLEKIKLQEVRAIANEPHYLSDFNYDNPEVVLISQVDRNQLLLPWEMDQRRKGFPKMLRNPDFAQKIQSAERVEFVEKNFTQAARLYQKCMKTAEKTAQKSYAQLLLARALSKANRKKEALSHYRKILLLSPELTDEYGIPFSFYAAKRLQEEGTGYADVLKQIQIKLEEKYWLSPSAFYLLKELIERIVEISPDLSFRELAVDLRQTILKDVQKIEQALSLKKNFKALELAIRERTQEKENEPVWLPYGDGPWLISQVQTLDGSQHLLVVVQAKEILASLQSDPELGETFPAEISLITGISSEGESLGQNFHNIRIDFPSGKNPPLAKSWSSQRSIYILVLLLVLSVTLFGSYLLWRDVRRDVRMAEMRSQFVASVSHELKTPLTAIRMFAETLRMGRPKNMEAQSEYLDTIVNESQRLTRLLNNVLDFSRIEKGKRIYHPEPASLSEIVHAAARTMDYPFSQQGFRLHVYTEDDLPDVRVDRDALEQAILNLLSNAMKYSGNSRDIDLRLLRKDNHALIQVIDRGIGIEEREQRRIFDKFYRIPTPENKRTIGTGLGLALVSHIVKAQGGYVEVQSTHGKGSTFTIYLPLENA